MMEFLRFATSGFWTFCGVALLTAWTLQAVVALARTVPDMLRAALGREAK